MFPFVLLPYLGHLQTALLTGLLNLLVALVLAWQFRHRLGARALPAAILATVAIVALPTLLVFANRLDTWLEQALYQDTVVHSEQSQYQKLVVTRWGDDTRLYLDGNLQFSSSDEYRYHEMLVHAPIAYARQPQRALVIGGGDGLAAREVLRHDSVSSVTVVDLDPAITRLFMRMPVLRELNKQAFDDPRLSVVNADAWQWLADHGDLYDVIIVDLPDPSSEALARLYTSAFYHRVARRLAAGGVMITQATSPWFAPLAFWSIGATLQQAFDQVVPLQINVPSFGPWGFFLAAQHPLVQANEPVYAGRYFNAEQLRAARSMPADFQPRQVSANHIGTLEVLDYYRAGWDFVNKGKQAP